MTQNIQTLHDIVLPLVKSDSKDLSLRQLAVLTHVACTTTKLSVAPIAAALNISKPAVTRALDRLGEHGYSVREVDNTDKRKVEVFITSEGKRFLARVDKIVMRAILGEPVKNPRAPKGAPAMSVAA